MGFLLTPEQVSEGQHRRHYAHGILLNPSGEWVGTSGLLQLGLAGEVEPGPRRAELRCGRATGPPQGDLPVPPDSRKGKAKVPQPTEGTAVMAKGFSTQAAHQTSRKSSEDEPGVLSTQSFLEEDDMEPLSQQLQATSSRASEPLSNSDLSPGSLVDVPFFRTYGQLLDEEEWAPQPEVCRDQGGNWGVRKAQFREDLEPPSGYFPYYRSREENFPSLLHGGTQDTPTRKEVQAGCFCRRTVSIGSSAVSARPDLGSASSLTCCPILLVSAGHSQDSGLDAPLCSDAALRGHALCASGYVPYYRTPEEGLLGLLPWASSFSVGGSRSPQGSCHTVKGAGTGSSKSH